MKFSNFDWQFRWWGILPPWKKAWTHWSTPLLTEYDQDDWEWWVTQQIERIFKSRKIHLKIKIQEEPSSNPSVHLHDSYKNTRRDVLPVEQHLLGSLVPEKTLIFGFSLVFVLLFFPTFLKCMPLDDRTSWRQHLCPLFVTRQSHLNAVIS